jgi:hypothetical protein
MRFRRGAYLDQVLALSLSDERLKLGRGEGVHQARLGDHEQQDLGSRQYGQFVCLATKEALVRFSGRCADARQCAEVEVRCDGMGVRADGCHLAPTHLLHYSRLALREGDVPTRLVADKLDLNLATLATALLIVVIVVVGGAGAGTFDAATFDRIAIADRVRLVEVGRGGLVVLIRDVGHFFSCCSVKVSKVPRGRKGKKSGGDTLLVVVPIAYTGSGVERRGSVVGSCLCRRNLVGR